MPRSSLTSAADSTIVITMKPGLTGHPASSSRSCTASMVPSSFTRTPAFAGSGAFSSAARQTCRAAGLRCGGTPSSRSIRCTSAS